ESFSEGLAVIQFTQDGKCGYIDKSGKLVISPEFELAESFSEGLAAVRIDCNLWGYINRTGKLVIEPQFRSVKRFSGGLAEITIGERWGYINQSGKVIWMSGPPTSQPKHQ
ncbi:MAG TPA: WG repeat-containing protein, partial [Acidobacteriota bacterium]|nr:WG repeat-containing protein [Acidobacteriota bacterium]